MIAKPHVLVVGDVMLDIYRRMTNMRLDQATRNPTGSVASTTYVAGGAGHVATCLAELEMPVTLVGAVGRDDAGTTLRNILEFTTGLTADLTTDLEVTTQKTRLTDDNCRTVARCDDEAHGSPFTDVMPALAEALQRNPRVVIVSDYGKGVVTPRIVTAILNYACSAPIRVIWDMSPKSTAAAEIHHDILVANCHNAKQLGKLTGSLVSARTAAKQLTTQFRANDYIVTDGAAGVVRLPRGGQLSMYHTDGRPAIDATGAGDAFVAALAHSLCSDPSLASAIRWGIAAADVAVSRHGTFSPPLYTVYKQAVASNPAGKIVSLQQAAQLAESGKVNMQSVGCANGVFDMLHYGHYQLLAQAKAQCDFLIVLVNSDESVRRIKGADRPVICADHRMALLAGLACVDAVVMFDGDTPEAELATLEPHVLFKGPEYQSAGTIPGERSVDMIVFIKDNYPRTSDIIARARHSDQTP